MLTAEENRRLTETGPNTPMGTWFRRYWLPICLSEELLSGGAPVALTILGEDLMALRDPQGNVSVMYRYCPHRGVSLAYGRNEVGGVRCIYHGWKIGPDGCLLETPNARTTERFRTGVRQPAYPVQEAGGVVWGYLGPAASQPEFPEWPWVRLASDSCRPVKVWVDCNYLQGLEGGVDTSHINFLHRTDINLASVDPEPELTIADTPFGFRYSGFRKGPRPGTHLVRTTQFVLPSFVFIPPPRGNAAGIQMHQMAIPVDDQHHWFFGIRYRLEGPWEEDYRAQFALDAQFRPRRNRANHHLQDRTRMAAGHWSGIDGVRSQDMAVVESAPSTMDRHEEHVVGADVAVLRLRQVLLNAMETVAQGGQAPGIGPAVAFRTLSGEEMVISRD